MLQEGKKYLYDGWFGNGPCFEELNGTTSENPDGEIYLFGKDGYYLMKRGFVELERKECVALVVLFTKLGSMTQSVLNGIDLK